MWGENLILVSGMSDSEVQDRDGTAYALTVMQLKGKQRGKDLVEITNNK